MIRREQMRLRRTFRRLLLLSLASPGAVQACSSSSSSNPGTGQDAGYDSTVGYDAPKGYDARLDTAPPLDTGLGNDSALDSGASCVANGPYYNDASWAQLPDSG